eukprot:TRINITY_DN4939_c0_g2_i1.p1 TRINITY_DN4939_c0_g2~~TRINITY_DN4939_c0_g2_i1.p1  ORF type:complete len:579 (-),score=164.96 TRINITY_DN4939_c0_g2_i1:57-1697(-)
MYGQGILASEVTEPNASFTSQDGELQEVALESVDGNVSFEGGQLHQIGDRAGAESEADNQDTWLLFSTEGENRCQEGLQMGNTQSVDKVNTSSTEEDLVVVSDLQQDESQLRQLQLPPATEQEAAQSASENEFLGSIKLEDTPTKQEAKVEPVSYFVPKVGDIVLALVVSANHLGADLDIGAEKLARITLREVLTDTFSGKDETWKIPPVEAAAGVEEGESEGGEEDADAPQNGKMSPQRTILCVADPADDPSLFMFRGITTSGGKRAGSMGVPVLEVGMVVTAEVVGETVTGRPLLSVARVGTRMAWQRARQLMAEKSPIDVLVVGKNNGGVVARIEGLRAFMPVSYLEDAPEGGPPDVENLVGKMIRVMITEASEERTRLIISQRAAISHARLKKWNIGCLVEGRVIRTLDYGALCAINGCELRGLLHISNISRAHVPMTKDVFAEGDYVKALIVDANNRGFSLSTKDLESVDGLMMRNPQMVYEEAERMAEIFRQELDLEEEEEDPDPESDLLPTGGRAEESGKWALYNDSHFQFIPKDQIDN